MGLFTLSRLGPGFRWTSAAVGVALLCAGWSLDRPGPSNPTAQHVFYAQEGAKAYWRSRSETAPDALAKLGARVSNAPGFFSAGPGPSWAAPAPSAGLPEPEIEILDDKASSGRRHLRFLARSRRGAGELFIEASGAQISNAKLNGLAAFSGRGPAWSARVFNAPSGVAVDLEMDLRSAPKIRVVDRSFGLPFPLPTLKPAQIEAPGFSPMSSQSVTEITLKAFGSTPATAQ